MLAELPAGVRRAQSTQLGKPSVALTRREIIKSEVLAVHRPA
jgi:hypothetical protein